MNLPVHPVDIVSIIYVAVAAIMGLRRGLSGELARMVAAAAILGVAWWLYPVAGDYLYRNTRIESPELAQRGAFLALLVIGFLVALALRLLLKAIMEFKFKGLLERAGGAAAGAIRAGIVLTALVVLVNLFSHGFFYAAIVENSVTGRFITAHGMPVYEHLAEDYPDRVPRPMPAGHEPRPDDGRETRNPSASQEPGI